MKKKIVHPLDRWIKGRKITLYALARDAGISFRALYRHVKPDKVIDAKASTIIAVEDATGGEVTAQEQIDWIRANK